MGATPSSSDQVHDIKQLWSEECAELASEGVDNKLMLDHERKWDMRVLFSSRYVTI